MDVDSNESREEIFTFSKIYSVDKLRLIEVEPSFLENLDNGSLEIRGKPDEESLLVTKTETHRMRLAETSNTWLIVDEDLEKQKCDKRQIIGAVTQYYILERTIAQVHKIKDMLMESQYELECDEASEQQSPVTYTFADLKECVQASDKEILDYLSSLDAIEINGCWRLLSKPYYTAVLEDILISIEELGLSVDLISLENILTKTTDYSKEIVRCVLKMFSEPQQGEGDVFKLSEKKVCLFRIDQAINECKGKSARTDLVVKMVESTLPDEMKMDMNYLKGKYISKTDEFGDEILVPFNESQLSVDSKKRFLQLFAFKDTWLKEELELYLKTLLEAGENFDKLLLKNTRAFTEKVGNNVVKVFRERGTRAKKKRRRNS